MELDRENILKAAKCCAVEGSCDNCPRKSLVMDSAVDCMDGMVKNAIALIEKQSVDLRAKEVEINELTEELDRYRHELSRLKAELVKERSNK